MSEAIQDDKVVFMHYTLRDPAGNVVDQSDPNVPVPYLHGAGNLVPGLEKAMADRAVGEKFEATVSAAEGYGEREGEPFDVPRGEFPPGIEITPGMDFLTQDERGQPFPVWVVGVAADTVKLDKNHPLAGVELHFSIEVVAIRDATEEELQHGHPHAPGGHHHH